MVSRRSFTVTNNTIINKEGNRHDISTKQRQNNRDTVLERGIFLG